MVAPWRLGQHGRNNKFFWFYFRDRNWADPTQPYPVIYSKVQPSPPTQLESERSPPTKSATPAPSHDPPHPAARRTQPTTPTPAATSIGHTTSRRRWAPTQMAVTSTCMNDGKHRGFCVFQWCALPFIFLFNFVFSVWHPFLCLQLFFRFAIWHPLLLLTVPFLFLFSNWHHIFFCSILF